jgi:hypothetical protein
MAKDNASEYDLIYILKNILHKKMLTGRQFSIERNEASHNGPGKKPSNTNKR